MVGGHAAELAGVFHAPEQVVVGGVVLRDHGRAAARGVGDQDVDFVTAQVGALRRLAEGRRGLLLLRVLAELVAFLRDVPAYGGEEARDFFVVRVLFDQRLEEVFDREAGDAFVAAGEFVLRLAFEAADFDHGVLHGAFEFAR